MKEQPDVNGNVNEEAGDVNEDNVDDRYRLDYDAAAIVFKAGAPFELVLPHIGDEDLVDVNGPEFLGMALMMLLKLDENGVIENKEMLALLEQQFEEMVGMLDAPEEEEGANALD